MAAKKQTAKRRTSARPRLVGDRLEAVLDRAAEVFLAEGFQAASINAIASQAGVSKASLYTRFPGKEELFQAVIERRIDRIFNEVTANLTSDMPLEDALRTFGTRLLESALSDAQIQLIRIISMEVQRFPQLASRFYEGGSARAIGVFSSYLKSKRNQGELIAEDPLVMARHFFSLVVGPALFSRLLGVEAQMAYTKRGVTHLQSAMQTFLRAFRMRE